MPATLVEKCRKLHNKQNFNHPTLNSPSYPFPISSPASPFLSTIPSSSVNRAFNSPLTSATNIVSKK